MYYGSMYYDKEGLLYSLGDKRLSSNQVTKRWNVKLTYHGNELTTDITTGSILRRMVKRDITKSGPAIAAIFEVITNNMII